MTDVEESGGGPDDKHVVTAFLRRDDGRVLLVRRSARVGTFQGRWSAISGYVETVSPYDQAVREIGEETGVDPSALTLIAGGTPVVAEAPDYGVRFIVHPFLFRLDPEVRVALDWENTESRWILPEEIAVHETVPKLAEAYDSCLAAAAGNARTDQQ